MGDKSKIEWTDATWNPTTGCTRVAQGCKNCYAERMATRLQAMGVPAYQGVVDRNGRWTGQVNLVESALELPLRWRRPRRIFVDSMSDLFHPAVPFEYIDRVFEVMGAAGQHTFQVLTKRPQQMVEFLRWTNLLGSGDFYKNVWLGVSVAEQDDTYLIPWLLYVTAAVRFVSYEPALEKVNFEPYLSGPDHLDWLICGCESGPNARPMDIDWARSARDQCQAAEVAFFLKQLVVAGQLVKTPELDGRRWTEYPEGSGV